MKSKTLDAVAQTSGLPYRRLAVGWRSPGPTRVRKACVQQAESLRYGRPEVCATVAFPARSLLCFIVALWLSSIHWFVTSAADSATPAERATNDFVFIDNGELRLGVKKSSGAGIAYLAPSTTGENVINHWDRGRLVQQSYYGAKDGSMWDKQPWRWNPVQGGGWRHEPSRVLELKTERTSLYAKTMAKHWATGADLPEVIFEEWISLTGAVAHVKFRMTYTGTNSHPKIHHELPAVFVEPQYDTLLVYEGTNAWSGGALSRSKPGWPNESRKFTEHWAAYVNTNDFGVGVLVPVADTLTCYRFGDGKREHGSCSYFAPLKSFAITSGMQFEYEVWLTIGTAKEIRERFRALVQDEGKP